MSTQAEWFANVITHPLGYKVCCLLARNRDVLSEFDIVKVSRESSILGTGEDWHSATYLFKDGSGLRIHTNFRTSTVEVKGIV